ncbi:MULTISPECIES: condensation domain-containing protein, partial [unclassified Streptomyces]|uniref:non-ribosomal peptide synthetase n=1 Tax=unclassified Streptomyces TaxID=2593676 RepID=UPI001F04ABD5
MIPVSFAQRSLWFLGRLEGPSATYNVPLVVRLRGELDLKALDLALVDVVGRHESLRTVFVEVDGQPYQRILSVEEAAPTLVVRESDGERISADVAEVSAYAFDLESEIPVRTWLFDVAPGEWVLVAVVHHIAGDGWSLGPFARDLGVAYASRCEGAAPRWEPLPVQYTDYTLWQRELLGDEGDPDSTVAGQMEFWRGELAGIPQELALPLDRPRPVAASYLGDVVELALDARVHRAVVSLARERGASVFMVLQAAVAALLSRLGAGTDIPIGSPVAGRSDEALDDLVGFFVNTLVLRTDVSGDPSFAELVERARETDLRAFGAQDVPFERLVEVLNPVRSMARHPLFQVALAFQTAPASELVMPGLEVVVELGGTQTAKFDLSFHLAESFTGRGEPAGITGGIEFATDLFDRSTIERMAGWLARLLEEVLADPERPVSRARVADDAERYLVLEEWNDTAVAVADDTLPVLFEEQVARTPDSVAVVFDGVEVSYREVNKRANRLARLLAGQGAGPERFVAIALPRSIDLVTALLAVLKTGAAYVPVDPDYPVDRIACILDDADPMCVVTLQDNSGVELPAGTTRIALDDPATQHALDAQATEDLTDAERVAPLDAHMLAYVIYTSGSTGRPKGVVVGHGALVNHLAAVAERVPLRAGDRLVAVTTVSFDIAALELFLPLVSGAAVVLAHRDTVRDPVALRDLVRTSGATVLQAVPSLWRALLEAGDWPAGVRALVGGEAVPEELAARLRALDVTAVNLYGPTEATIWATSAEVAEDPTVIGRPFANTRVYVLDAALQPCPPGVAGEL